jgi:hypothetical protein
MHVRRVPHQEAAIVTSGRQDDIVIVNIGNVTVPSWPTRLI